jgi:hypothetical protein
MKGIVGLLAGLILAGCGGPEPRARTVTELAEDPAVLQGLVARCNADKRAAMTDLECANARTAMERLGQQEDAKRDAQHEAEFERRRALRRAAQDEAAKAAAAAKPAYDPYTAPVGSEPPSPTPKQ